MDIESVDTIIIGGGVSGLYAARLLRDAGREPVVLEASGGVGGRLRSLEVEGASLDVGATWFWANEPRIVALIGELGLETHAQFLEGDALYQVPEGVHRLDGNPVDAAAGRVSAGMQQIAEGLASSLPQSAVRLGCRVMAVRASATGLELEIGMLGDEGGGGLLRADHVVLALPPALAVESIRFTPLLEPDMLELASRTPVWMGGVTKVVMRFEEAFWRSRGLAGAVISSVGPMREVHDMSGPDGVPAALFGFVPPASPGAPTVSEGAIRDQLRALFGDEAPVPTHVLIQDWRNESLTSPPGVEGLQAYEAFGHPLYARPVFGGRMHWGSTETANAFPGHIEGALVAGERAADATLSHVSASEAF